MIPLLCASAFAAQSSDFNDRVTELLLVETAQRLELHKDQITMLHLGLHNVSCPDDAEISLRIPSAEDFRGPVEVFVEATDGSDRCGKWKIQSRMAIFKPAWVADTSYSPGQIVQMSQKSVRYDLSTGTPITEEQVQREALTHIQKNEVITLERTRVVPDAKNGKKVDIVVKSGDLHIRSDGTLMGNAYLGDSVKVISMATRQVIEGILVDSNTVELMVGASQSRGKP
ncbi:MAG: flagellar basal body P-ring formation chaperone FlgA [Myxococcota bacterium]|nr:flagellar basal body P-ring formation chaperone FlgA [Myxococcota bacterium]